MSDLRVWVTVPTYNEVENIEVLVERIRAALPDAHILVVDDNSPDGTADKAEALGAEFGGIEVLRRPRKIGLGSAYRAGHAIGIARGYDVMVQIDADLSHDPADLPRLARRRRPGRRSRDRLAVRARWQRAELAQAPTRPLRIGATATRRSASASTCATPPPATARTARRFCRRWTSTPLTRPDTASRSR